MDKCKCGTCQYIEDMHNMFEALQHDQECLSKQGLATEENVALIQENLLPSLQKNMSSLQDNMGTLQESQLLIADHIKGSNKVLEHLTKQTSDVIEILQKITTMIIKRLYSLF